MVQRPLFAPTRRPPPAPIEVTPPSDPGPASPLPPPPPALALSGVILGGGVGVALVQRQGDASPIRVALGGQVDGWTVAEIHSRTIVLRLGARSVTVGLPAR